MDQTYLKERLSYDPSTGVFTWNRCEKMSNKYNSRFAGKATRHVYQRKDGYKMVRIRMDGKEYAASRLAWLYMTGSWPTEHIDHIDHDTTNNRFANLREVSHAENQKNKTMLATNTSGITGVSWYKALGKWYAYIGASGERVNGGYFKEFDDAVARRKELEIQYGFHPNHGVRRPAGG